ncbi:MAG: hypothetical protein R2882_13950 [Gemmatimonadales bacterium]
MDPSYRTLLEFDSAGTLIRHIGRDGAGPANSSPYSVAWLGDTLALLDPGGRIGVFDRAGEWVTSWPVRRITGGQIIRLYRTPGGFWAYALRPTDEGNEPVFVPRYSSRGPEDSVVVRRPTAGLAPMRTCQRADRGLSFFTTPFGGTPFFVPAGGDAQAVAVTSSMRSRWSAAPATLRLIRRSLPPRCRE